MMNTQRFKRYTHISDRYHHLGSLCLLPFKEIQIYVCIHTGLSSVGQDLAKTLAYVSAPGAAILDVCCMYMCVFIVSICVYVCCMYMCMYIGCICACLYVYCMYMCKYNVCICVYVYCMYMCMYIGCICACILYIYVYMIIVCICV